jgi:hypothetical protein
MYKMKVLRILVACEESQAVCIAFRKLGHEAFSCDTEPCSGGHPEWHIQADIREILFHFDGTPRKHSWDLIIAFPPCTHLAVSGALRFKEKQADGRQQQGIDFFMMFANYPCAHIAIENPIGIMSTKWRKPDQIIHPWQFGHPEEKRTCLWLKGLPKLVPTNILQLPETGHWENQTKDKQNKVIVDGHWISYKDPRTAKLRSKTYKGIAEAFAIQYSEYLEQLT